jgi:hypothetical protein
LYNNYKNNTLSNIKLYYKQFRHKNLSTIGNLFNIKMPSNYKLNCDAYITAKAINIILRETTIKLKQYLDKVVIDIYRPLILIS